MILSSPSCKLTCIPAGYRGLLCSPGPAIPILEALALVGNAMTAHTRRLVMHGESVHHDLYCLEFIALEISSLLAAEDATVKRKKEEINAKVLTLFSGNCGTLRNLEGLDADLNHINNLWREARDPLSLGIHAFNGVQSDLTAPSDHQAIPTPARTLVRSCRQTRQQF